jgi:hypothetical protein
MKLYFIQKINKLSLLKNILKFFITKKVIYRVLFYLYLFLSFIGIAYYVIKFKETYSIVNLEIIMGIWLLFFIILRVLCLKYSNNEEN